MSIFSKFVNRIRKTSTKQKVVAGAFTIALFSAVGLGVANRQDIFASGSNDCSGMAILRCGADSPSNYVNKLKKNSPSDLQKLAKHFGLSKGEYNDFKNNARKGTVYKDGRVVVDGETVMDDVWVLGRQKKSYSTVNSNNGAYKVSGKTYYASYPKDGWPWNSQPAWVLFDKKGEVEHVVLAPCGNMVKGDKKDVKASCKRLNTKKVGLNKYELRTNTYTNRLADVKKVEYFFNGKKIGQSSNGGNNYKITETISKTGTVTAKVHVKVPGKQTIVVTDSDCKKKLTYKKPYYECKNLKATVRNEDENLYRFTVYTKQGNGASLKNADFIVNGKTEAKNVTKKDGNGRIYLERELDWGKSYTVKAKVKFNVNGKTKSDVCKVKLTTKKPFYACEALSAKVVKEEEDKTTYLFTANTSQGNGAELKGADFSVNGDSVATDVTDTDNSGNIVFEHALDGGNEYKVEATAKFTVNGKTVTDRGDCVTKVSPKKPFYACDLLRAESIDEEARKFRFTVIASFGDGAELENADFAIWKSGDADNKTVVEGVTQKDEDGNIYHEADFEADGQERVVEATVNFTVLGSAKSVTCEARVTPEEEPKCPIPGKEHLPPDSPECVEEPEDDGEVLGKELPKTGAGSVVGLFASATGVGAAAHRIFQRRRL